MFLDAKKIHFVGLGGIGTSALAKFVLSKGKTITGSDAQMSEMTAQFLRRGVTVHEGHDERHVPYDTEFLIYSPAVPESNPERLKARSLGIPECSYSEALGELSKQYSTIVVTGTHGKSTTTAMLGLMLEAGGYDPTVILGSLVPTFPEGNIRIGKGRFLVVEGCEHQANMLKLHPEMIVLTSIEEDHLDFYKNLENIKKTFQTFVDSLTAKGLTIVNEDDPVSRQLTISNRVSYGVSGSAHYVFSDRETESGLQHAMISRQVPAETLGRLTLSVPGAFNVSNAMAAIAAAMELGIPFETCARVLKNYRGIWRRFERVGTWQGQEVISDYGHHPTAIRATVQAAREFFPGKKIVLCFEPHQHSRTEALFDDFVDALQSADATIVSEIYRVEGRTETQEVSSRDLVEKILESVPDKRVLYAKDIFQAQEMLTHVCAEFDECIVVIQGAGDIDELARALINLSVDQP